MSLIIKAKFGQLHKMIDRIEAIVRQHQHSLTRARPWWDDDLGSTKLKILTLQDKSDSETYLLWGDRILDDLQLSQLFGTKEGKTCCISIHWLC